MAPPVWPVSAWQCLTLLAVSRVTKKLKLAGETFFRIALLQSAADTMIKRGRDTSQWHEVAGCPAQSNVENEPQVVQHWQNSHQTFSGKERGMPTSCIKQSQMGSNQMKVKVPRRLDNGSKHAANFFWCSCNQVVSFNSVEDRRFCQFLSFSVAKCIRGCQTN